MTPEELDSRARRAFAYAHEHGAIDQIKGILLLVESAERERCAKALCYKCRIGVKRQEGVAGNAKLVHFDGDDITACAAEVIYR